MAPVHDIECYPNLAQLWPDACDQPGPEGRSIARVFPFDAVRLARIVSMKVDVKEPRVTWRADAGLKTAHSETDDTSTTELAGPLAFTIEGGTEVVHGLLMPRRT